MRVTLALAIGLFATPAWAQTATTGTGGGNTSTGVPTAVVAPPAEDLVPRTTGNIVAPPAENLVNGVAGGTPASTGAATNIGTGPGTSTGIGTTGTGTFTTNPNTLGTTTGLALPPALTAQSFFNPQATTFFGGNVGNQAAPGAGAVNMAGGIFAPTGTSLGSRPGGPGYVVAPLDPYDPDEPDALDYSRTP